MRFVQLQKLKQSFSRRENRCSMNHEDVSELLSHTTIPGVVQWVNHKTWFWKITWITVILIGLSIATYQSVDALRGYWENAIVQVISFNSKKELVFPAITICTNIIVDFGRNISNIDPEIRKLVLQADSEINGAENLQLSNLKHIINNYQRLITLKLFEHNLDEMKMTLGSPNFIRNCNWKRINCFELPDEIFLTEYNLRYGKCVTFNPGFRNPEVAKANQGFYAILDMNLRSRVHSINPNHALLLIHPTGAPPIPVPQSLIRLQPGRGVRIFLSGKNMRRQQVKSIRHCISHDDMHMPTEFYHTPETPYKYSTSACYASCNYRKLLTRESNPCIDPTIPLPALLTMKKQFPNTSLCPYRENIFASAPTLTNCKCPELCKEPINVPTTFTSSLLKSEWQGDHVEESSWKLANQITYNYSTVHVEFASTEYMRITEQQKYSLTDFFGLIGGNLSLWVGINVLCLLEMVEILIAYIQREIDKRRSKPVTRNRNRKARSYVFHPPHSSFHARLFE